MPEREQSWLYTYFYLPWVANGRLLEIGCGSGWQLARMQQAGWRTKGLDFDPGAVAAARGRGLDVDVGDVRDLHLEAASFDAIVMAHVLEHVFDPVGLLAECRRLLKPGGRLVSITPNGRSLGHRVYKAAWRGLEPPRHIAVFTKGGLNVACGRVDAQIVAASLQREAQIHERLGHRKVRRLGEMEQAHLVVGEIGKSIELCMDVAEAKHPFRSKFVRPDRAKAGDAPHLPSRIQGTAELGMRHSRLGLKDAVAKHDDASIALLARQAIDVAAACRGQASHVVTCRFERDTVR